MGADMYLDRDYFHGITLQQKNEEIAALKKELSILKQRMELLKLEDDPLIDSYAELVYRNQQALQQVSDALSELIKYNPIRDSSIDLDNLTRFKGRIQQAKKLLEELGFDY